MSISAKRITEILMDCLFNDDEIEDGKPKKEVEWVEVNGVHMHLGLVKNRLESYRTEITETLGKLDESFMTSGGGGMSFLNLCMDREGLQWGEHKNCEELIMLGIGLDLVSFPMPKEMWPALPGGVPYVQIKL